jgi:hypothetical protein
VTTAQLALEDVPPGVRSIAVSAFRAEDRERVASATVAADVAVVPLGLPAEVLLELRAVARTASAADGGDGRPVFFGAALRTVPLARDPVELGLLLRPAGVLDIEVEGEGAPLVLPSSRGGLPRPVASPGRTRLVVAEGTHRLEPTEDVEQKVLVGGRGLWSERARVTRVAVRWAPAPPPTALSRLELDLAASGGRELPRGALVETRSGDLRLEGRVRGFDALGQPVLDPEAEVALEARGVAAQLPATVTGLPGRFALRVEGSAGLLRVTARRGPLESRVDVDVRPPGLDVGPPAAVRLALLEPDRLLDPGAVLDAWVVDARGLPVRRAAGSIDLSMSDPWLRALDGDARRLDAASAGRARFRVLRASAPATGVVRAVGRYVSAPGQTWTATLSLPALESAP